MFNNKAYITKAETFALLKYVRNATDDVVEIGTYNGGTTINLAMALPPDIALWTIDIWGQFTSDNNPLTVYSTIAKTQRAFPIVGNSNYIGECWQRAIGFLFIDGGHDYHTALTDFQVWTPWLVPGGVVAMHDAYLSIADAQKQGIELPIALNGNKVAGELGVIQARIEIVNSGSWEVVDIVDTTVFLTRVERK